VRNRNILIIVGVLVLAPVVVLAWWFLSPLVFDQTVDEEFPLAANAVVPANMTTEEVNSLMVSMAKVDQPPMADAMPQEMASDTVSDGSASSSDAAAASGGPQIIASGNFRDADSFHQGSGAATIYRSADGSGLLRLEDFRVTNGPDLHVLLSPAADPASRDELQAASYVGLGKLKGNIGNQNYEIPANIEPNAQGSVIIYCMPFHVIFSVAPLAPAANP
jgi:hypothetical protein